MIEAMTTKHWTHFLPESGTIEKDGDAVQAIKIRILALLSELEDLQMEYEETNVALHAKCRKNWSIDEIDEAKAKAVVTQCKEPYPYSHQTIIL